MARKRGFSPLALTRFAGGYAVHIGNPADVSNSK